MLRFRIILDTREKEKRKQGFPVVVDLRLRGKRKRFGLKEMYFEISEWNTELQLPIANKNAMLHILKKTQQLENFHDKISNGESIALDDIKNSLLGIEKKIPDNDFYAFADQIIKEKELKKEGSSTGTQTSINNFLIYRDKLLFSEIDYNLLTGFRDWRLSLGNEKNTVHTYLRKIKFVYNEAVRKGLVEDKKPFGGVFKGIYVKPNRTKKRYLDKKTIYKLENLEGLTYSYQRTIHIWLLLFYFGGQSLIDVYYLKNKNVVNGRVFFKRSKLDDTGFEFDLKIFPKAQKIINLYKTDGEYLFGNWRKDHTGYKTFRRNFNRSLLKLQKQFKIPVLPKEGNLSIAVARHTFGTNGKFLFTDPDLLRELMGHERDGVDTIYKDRYPQKDRDAAHKKIIG